MSVTEGFMQVGSWDLRLRPDTPLALRDSFAHYWQIVITPSRQPAADASRSDAVLNARYRGPVLELSDDRLSLSGAGLIHYLTWSENEAPGPPAATAWDWSDYLLEMETNHSQWTQVGLDLQAAVDEPTDTWPDTTANTSDDLPTNMLDEILFLAGVLGCEFYVDTDRKFYGGGANSNTLFTVTTPDVILMRGQDGRDIDLTGLPIVGWDVAYDAWDHVTSVSVYGSGASATANVLLDTYAADGSATTREAIEISTSIDNGNDAARRASAIAAEHERRRVVGVSVDTYDIGRWMKPGDYLWAWDPVNDVVDTDNAVFYHGMHVTPAKLRLYSMTWPIQNGMGVYLLNKDNAASPAVLDLTDYVEWETGATTLEVDAPRRSALLF